MQEKIDGAIDGLTDSFSKPHAQGVIESGGSADAHARMWAEHGLPQMAADFLQLANLPPEEKARILAQAYTNAAERKRQLTKTLDWTDGEKEVQEAEQKAKDLIALIENK